MRLFVESDGLSNETKVYARNAANALQHYSNDPGVSARDGLQTATNSALGRFSCTDWEVGNSVYFLRTGEDKALPDA